MDREDLQFLIELQERMNKQDETSASCDFQASPYFWGIAENKIEWGIDPDYSSDEVCYYYDGSEYNSIEECKELFKDFLDEDDDDYETRLKQIEEISDWYDIDNYNDNYDIDGNVVYGRKVEDVISKYTGCFLTKQACKEHIENYGYNYSEPHTFAMTASRNPEFERVWNILKNTDWEQLADLEAKLAESESKLRGVNASFAGLQFDYCKSKKEYKEQEDLLSKIMASNSKLHLEVNKLKQQLAEKEKEIEKCDDEWREICDGKLETINRLIEEKHEFQQSQKQTAIAELKKAEKVIEKYVNNIDDMYDCLNAIDNQIKLLKGE